MYQGTLTHIFTYFELALHWHSSPACLPKKCPFTLPVRRNLEMEDGSVVHIPGYPQKKHLVTNSSWLRLLKMKMNKYK